MHKDIIDKDIIDIFRWEEELPGELVLLILTFSGSVRFGTRSVSFVVSKK
jgi:hypothetical protein